jgi:hypothetical protein
MRFPTLILIFLLCFTLVACASDDDNDNGAADADVTTEADVTEATAEVTEEPAPTSLDAEFAGPVNGQLYMFNGNAGDVVTLTMRGNSADLDPYITLFAPDGAVYASDDNSLGEGVGAALNDYELPEDGTYLLLATSLRGIGEPPVIPDGADEPNPQAYTIGWQGVDVVEPFALDSVDLTLTDVPLGTRFETTTDPAQPLNFVQIEATEAETMFDISTAGEGFAADTLIHVYNTAGERVAVRDDVAESRQASLTFEAPDAGDYIVLISVYNAFAVSLPVPEDVPYSFVIEQ